MVKPSESNTGEQQHCVCLSPRRFLAFVVQGLSPESLVGVKEGVPCAAVGTASALAAEHTSWAGGGG